MTAYDVEVLLEPIYEALANQPQMIQSKLEPVIDALQYQAQVEFGVIVGLGVVAGVLLIGYLLNRF